MRLLLASQNPLAWGEPPAQKHRYDASPSCLAQNFLHNLLLAGVEVSAHKHRYDASFTFSKLRTRLLVWHKISFTICYSPLANLLALFAQEKCAQRAHSNFQLISLLLQISLPSEIDFFNSQFSILNSQLSTLNSQFPTISAGISTRVYSQRSVVSSFATRVIPLDVRLSTM